MLVLVHHMCTHTLYVHISWLLCECVREKKEKSKADRLNLEGHAGNCISVTYQQSAVGSGVVARCCVVLCSWGYFGVSDVSVSMSVCMWACVGEYMRVCMVRWIVVLSVCGNRGYVRSYLSGASPGGNIPREFGSHKCRSRSRTHRPVGFLLSRLRLSGCKVLVPRADCTRVRKAPCLVI